VQAELNTGFTVTDAHIDALAMTRHRFHDDWNCTLHPEQPDIPCQERTTPTAFSTEAPLNDAASLRSPELTGMPRQQLDALVNELTPTLAEISEC
jgi:hypothetical protein